MTKITRIPGASGRRARGRPDRSIPFVSMCPKCGRPEPQLVFSLRALQRSLDQGQTIEAYCAMCDVFWPISPRERSKVATQLARQEP